MQYEYIESITNKQESSLQHFISVLSNQIFINNTILWNDVTSHITKSHYKVTLQSYITKL